MLNNIRYMPARSIVIIDTVRKQNKDIAIEIIGDWGDLRSENLQKNKSKKIPHHFRMEIFISA